ETPDHRRGGLDLRGADIGGGVNDLALQIRQRHDVIIDDAEGADPGSREIEQHRRTESAGANDQHAGAPERRLPRPADLAQHAMARVAFKLVIAEHADNIEVQAKPGDSSGKTPRGCSFTPARSGPLFRWQDRNRLDLEQRARPRQLRHADRGARRRRRGVEILVANIPEVHDVLADIDDVVVDLDQMIEADADRRERGFEVLERELDLFADVTAHFAGSIQAKLTGKINQATRADHFHDMAVARRFGDGVWI